MLFKDGGTREVGDSVYVLQVDRGIPLKAITCAPVLHMEYEVCINTTIYNLRIALFGRLIEMYTKACK